jgi:hypothetical protein
MVWGTPRWSTRTALPRNAVGTLATAPEVRTQGKVAGRGADDQRRTKARGQFRLRNCNRRAAEVRAIDHVYRHAVQCHVLYASCDDEMERRIEWEPPRGHGTPLGEMKVIGVGSRMIPGLKSAAFTIGACSGMSSQPAVIKPNTPKHITAITPR